MTVRQCDWRDIAVLHRSRDESIYLDSALLLTRGDHFLSSVLFSFLVPSLSIFTCVSNGNGGDHPSLIGQFIHTAGSASSHLTFLTPEEAISVDLVGPLIDFMITILGERGALRLLADVDEKSGAFEVLRKCGFVIYTRQHLWRLSDWKDRPTERRSWRMAVEEDSNAIRNLYNNLVSGLVQQIEPFTVRRPRGLVYYQNGELLGYVGLKQGREGIWLLPFIHPDAQGIPDLLIDMVQNIPNRLDRPVYLCVRINQSWLEPWLEELGADSGSHQAALVRQMVVQQRAGRAFAIPALETGQPKISAPIAHVEIQQGYASEKDNR